MAGADNDKFINQSISHFRILEQIGEGGMGQVYKAIDLRLQRAVALKFLSPALIENEKALLRFQLEAVAASAINHPNICTIYDVVTVPPNHFIVMEYVNGPTLRAILRGQGRLSEWDVAWIIEQICPPLALAHEAGIVHRDIKPDNILVVAEPPHVKITDFGLAKLAAETAEVTTTATQGFRKTEEAQPTLFSADVMITTLSGLMGTTSYMSPEQVKREAVDFRSDIFSIGAMIFELLAGVKLFDGATQIEVLERIATFNDIKPAVVKDGVPHDWLPILTACLQNDPKQRCQTVDALLSETRRLQRRLRPTHSLFGEKKDVAATGRNISRNRIFKWFALPVLAALFLFLSVFGARHWSAHLTSKPDSTVAVMDSIDVTTTSAEAYFYFIKGRKAWWRYDNHSAIENLQIAVEMDTSFSYAYCLLGLLCNWNERLQEAAVYFQKSFNNFDRLTAWEKMLVRGFQYYSRDESKPMLEQFEALVREYPYVIDGYLGAMLACERLGDHDRAIDFGLRLLEVDSTHIAGYNNLADLYYWKGDLNRTLYYAEKQLKVILDSDDLSGVEVAYEWVGRSNHMLGNDQNAEENLQKALAYDPQNHDASELLAEVLMLQAKLMQAEKTLKTAMSMPMKQEYRAALYISLGRLYVFMGRYADGIETFGKGKIIYRELDYIPGVLAASSECWQIYFELDRLQLIDDDLDYVSKTVPQSLLNKNKYYIEWQTVAAIRRGDFQSAETWVMRARSLSGGNLANVPEIDYLIAQQNFQQALQRLQLQTEKDPFRARGFLIDAHYKKARLLLAENRLAEASHDCLSALETRRFLRLCGICSYYMKSIALLAEIYEKMGDKEKALAQCDRFLRYWQYADPGIPLLLEVQERKERLAGQQVADS